MTLDKKTLFVTGANRGIGRALVETALRRNAGKIYAAARNTAELPDFGDSRVVPIQLDITDPAQVERAVAAAADVQILVNNAGVLAFAGLLGGSMDLLIRDMEVNYFGTLRVTRAFAPVIVANGGGTVAIVSSIVGLASMALIGGYSASKAALFSAIQALRAELKPQGVAVAGIFPGPIDTDMAKGIDMPKTSATDTAQAIWTGIAHGQEDIFPDPMSANLGALWQHDPKALERRFAG